MPPLVEVDESADPADGRLLGAQETRILLAIPEPKAEIFFFLAQTAARPSEARVLRVRDWTGQEVQISRAAKDRRTGGIGRGLKSRK